MIEKYRIEANIFNYADFENFKVIVMYFNEFSMAESVFFYFDDNHHRPIRLFNNNTNELIMSVENDIRTGC